MAKKIAGTLLISICMILSFGLNAFAARTEGVEAVVSELVLSMDGRDWEKYAELQVSEKKDMYTTFFSDVRNISERAGVLNVKSASLEELVEVAYPDVMDLIYDDYRDKKIKVFVAGIDYQVYKDTKYFSSGINYNLIVCLEEEGQWKIADLLQLNSPKLLTERGYTFSKNYDMAIKVMEARETGVLMNYNGEEFGNIYGAGSKSTFAIGNADEVPTDSTTIRYNNGTSTTNLSYHFYCLGVLAGELKTTTFDGEVRKAQAIAIKTYSWYYLIHPISPSMGYDIKSNMQSYKPGDININQQVTVDYNAAKGVWIESADGKIFEALYKQGTNSRPAQYSGEFKQNGALWLYNNNVATTYNSLLHYFYDTNSTTKIKFFDNNKNELNL